MYLDYNRATYGHQNNIYIIYTEYIIAFSYQYENTTEKNKEKNCLGVKCLSCANNCRKSYLDVRSPPNVQLL